VTEAKQHHYSLHIFDEREFRHRFLPALQGDEAIVRELLEAANAAGPSWTALHKMFDETRPLWEQAMEAQDGHAAQRTGFAGFARLQAHLRPAYVITGAGLTHIERGAFPELCSYIKSPGVLLMEGDSALPQVPANLPSRVPGRCQTTPSGGGVVLKEDVRPFLQALRGDLPRLAESFSRQGLPAEQAITLILAAAVEAKLKGSALFEAVDCFVEDTHLPADHQLTWERQEQLPTAIRREAGRVFGREVVSERLQQMLEEEVPRRPASAVPYSPQSSYSVGQKIEHKNFGEGEVTRVLDSRRLKVRFAEEEKVLVQGLKPAAPRRPEPEDERDDSDSDESAE